VFALTSRFFTTGVGVAVCLFEVADALVSDFLTEGAADGAAEGAAEFFV